VTVLHEGVYQAMLIMHLVPSAIFEGCDVHVTRILWTNYPKPSIILHCTNKEKVIYMYNIAYINLYVHN